MNAIADSTRSASGTSTTNANAARRFVSGVMLGILMLTGIALLLMGKTNNWLPGFFVVIAAIASAVAQSQQLPIQNVLLATGVMLVVAMLFESGWFVIVGHTDNSLLAHWPIPLIWVTALFTSRGVAKLVLRRHPGSARYGIEIMALTIALGVILFLAATPVAADAGGVSYQFKRAGDIAVQIAGRSFSALVILLIATPALLNKKPAKLQRDWHPLLLWVFVMLIAAARMGTRNLWPAAVEIGATLPVILLAVREVRRTTSEL